jgi:hypothetical protein
VATDGRTVGSSGAPILACSSPRHSDPAEVSALHAGPIDSDGMLGTVIRVQPSTRALLARVVSEKDLRSGSIWLSTNPQSSPSTARRACPTCPGRGEVVGRSVAGLTRPLAAMTSPLASFRPAPNVSLPTKAALSKVAGRLDARLQLASARRIYVTKLARFVTPTGFPLDKYMCT